MDRMLEFKDQSVGELTALSEDLLKDIFAMKNEVSTTRKLDKPHLLRLKKRNRARILTLLAQKEKSK